MVGYSSHIWCKLLSNTCYLFSLLFFFFASVKLLQNLRLHQKLLSYYYYSNVFPPLPFPSKKASSSLCSTFFFVLEGRNLSNSSTTEVFEVNAKFVATWLKHWRRKEAKLCSKYYSIIYNIHLKTKKRPIIKEKTNRKGSCQSFSFVLKTDLIPSKTN